LVGDEHENWVCPISTLEIARLVAVGDIRFGVPLADWIMRSMAELSAQTVPMSHEVAMEPMRCPEHFTGIRLTVSSSPRPGGAG
jgi:PIN domain nuclease of toxin-antitoxin system